MGETFYAFLRGLFPFEKCGFGNFACLVSFQIAAKYSGIFQNDDFSL